MSKQTTVFRDKNHSRFVIFDDCNGLQFAVSPETVESIETERELKYEGNHYKATGKIVVLIHAIGNNNYYKTYTPIEEVVERLNSVLEQDSPQDSNNV